MYKEKIGIMNIKNLKFFINVSKYLLKNTIHKNGIQILALIQPATIKTINMIKSQFYFFIITYLSIASN